MDEKESKRTLATVFVFCFRTVTCDCKDPGARAGNRYQGGSNAYSFPAKGLQEWGKAQKVRYTKTAKGDKTVLVLTYAAKQTVHGKKSVTLWFEQEKDQGYRLTMVDATNLLDANEKASSEKEITTEKENKGTELARLINKLGTPQRLVWGELLDGEEGFLATYQIPGQAEVVMELKKKGKKLVLI